MAEAEARAPTWADLQALEKRISLTMLKIRDLYSVIDGLSEAEREAKEAKALMEERAALTRELARLNSELMDLDFSGMSEAERAAEAERLRREKLEEARRLKEAGDPRFREVEAMARIIDFDPKDIEGMYFNRFYPVDLANFDHDEESPLGPMRFTNTAFEQAVEVCQSVNFLYVKICCSDVGFPIQVYGTVIARDCMDYKCVYLFRRDRDHCQTINSKDDSLILTGPKRGLVLLDANYVETDLKIKDHQGQDRELSKGIISIRGLAGRSLEKCQVESKSLATRLSTVNITYAVVIDAVEATVGIKVLKGKFHGTITAHTTSVQNKVVFYDSEVAGGDGRHRVIQLLRRVVSVSVEDKLIVQAKTGDGKSVRRIEFTPRVNCGDEGVITVGATKMRVRVAWSVMDP